jgi:hypothetical protein
VPAEALALARQFLTRAVLSAIGIRRLAFRDDTYLIEYKDRIALERAFPPRSIELRPLRAGRAHLVIPLGQREPAKALAWILALLRQHERPTKMAAHESR